MSPSRLLSVAAILGALVVQPAFAASPPAHVFSDPAFAWRDVSGHDLHAALARKPWARVVVALRPAVRPVGDSISAARVASVQSRVLRGLRAGDFRVAVRWSEIPAFAGLVSRSGLAKLTADPDVLRVDLDVPGTVDDAQSLPLIKGDTAHTNGFLGSGSTVAIIDTGVDTGHPDLASSVVDEHCFCTNLDGSGCCQGQTIEAAGAGSAMDDNGHGTNVGGIVAGAGTAAPEGVAPAAKLVSVKVINATGSFAGTSQVISGFNWVLADHPEVKVVNMSLGTTTLFPDSCDSDTAYTLAFASAINTLRSRGGLTFVAAGNSAAKSSLSAPACVAGAVAVGAVYDSNLGGGVTYPDCTDVATAADQVTCFSNSSPALDLLAPGALITSTGLGGTQSTYAGTSQACPHAAGAAAVLFAAAAPSVTADTIENALKTSGKSITDVANGRVTPRIDVAAALDALAVAPAPAPPPPSGGGPPNSTYPPPASLPTPPAGGSGRSPQIDVAAKLEFARVRTRASAVRFLTIRNLGDLALRVNPLARLGAPFSYVQHTGAFTVPRGGSARIKIAFRPRTSGFFRTTLLISSDDPARPQVSVEVSGLAARRR